MYDIPDHPIIRNLERTGYPWWGEVEYPHCPVCGEECEDVYQANGEVLGCDECVRVCNAWEVPACFHDGSCLVKG